MIFTWQLGPYKHVLACAGHDAGYETATHGIRVIFEDDTIWLNSLRKKNFFNFEVFHLPQKFYPQKFIG